MMLYRPRQRVVVLGDGSRLCLERAREEWFGRAVNAEDIVIQLFAPRDTST